MAPIPNESYTFSPKTLSTQERTRLYERFREDRRSPLPPAKWQRAQAAVLMMSEAGLRLSEAAAITYFDVTLAGVTRYSMTVRPEIAKYNQGGEIPMTTILQEALSALIMHLNKKLSPQWEIPLLSLASPKEHITPRQISRIVTDTVQEACGVRANPHMLRHTFATRLRNVTDLSTLQCLLRHKNLSSTQIYLHPSMDETRQAMNSLNEPEKGASR